MQHNSFGLQNSKNNTYYNPIPKIRSLLQNLDAELSDLCNKCTLPQTYTSTMNTPIKGINQQQTAISKTTTTATSNESQSKAQIPVRTLSGIYRAKVIDAYRNRRIFTVYGNYHTIRRAMLKRGWLEKFAPGRLPRLQSLSLEMLLPLAKRGNDFEAAAISKIIGNFPAFFIWQPKLQSDTSADVLPHRNRIRRGKNLDFTTKIGLIGCGEQRQWYHQEGVCKMSHPRVFRLSGSVDERVAFIEEYRLTQCRSLLRHVFENLHLYDELVDATEKRGECTVLPNIITFALTHVRKELDDWENSTIDENVDKTPNATEDEPVDWQNFMANSQLILHGNTRFKVARSELLDLARQCQMVHDKVIEKCPEYRWDGSRNLWILKPGFQCRGQGIVIRNSLTDILQWGATNMNRQYIAQKYIERPLLIYKTKFDIRQYMLVNITDKTLAIWLYRDCYLRFSGQEYTIDDLRESIHLTNNSVQKKFKTKQSRDLRLPKNNMWCLEEFKTYLTQQMAPDDTWNNRIFAGIKENLVAVVLASLDETEFVENAFELYGCDFMLDEKYYPILIEINATPDMSPSTNVTARMCPRVLNDVVKVIVDRPRNVRAATGMFELVYNVNYKTKRDFDPQIGLSVKGKAMQLHQPKPIPYRVKLMKKPMQMIRKTENTLKIPLKRLQRKKPYILEKPDPGHINVQNSGIVYTKPLKATTKQALALRFTRPK